MSDSVVDIKATMEKTIITTRVPSLIALTKTLPTADELRGQRKATIAARQPKTSSGKSETADERNEIRSRQRAAATVGRTIAIRQLEKIGPLLRTAGRSTYRCPFGIGATREYDLTSKEATTDKNEAAARFLASRLAKHGISVNIHENGEMVAYW
jgi:hypothetical protein